MSETLEMIILGIIQGLTEFLPVSSSGHLELAKYFLGDQFAAADSMQVTVALHVATAMSTVVVFHKEIWKIITGLFSPEDSQHRIFALKIIISMIPAVIVGLFFEDVIDEMFKGKYVLVACMLLISAGLLFFANSKKNAVGELDFKKSLLIGIAQAIAITPGISRSGATISTALLLNVSRFDAARFSFLMVVPLIFGKIAKDLLDSEPITHQINMSSLLAGCVAAFIVGVMACRWMISLVREVKLIYFAIYCILASISFLVYYYLHQ
ncbi:MAG TPA: undecaprenyl-diphosphate phosphatase [Saprospiraceae bacterium]|nr:undecaprenyl-diphosphate phosphatase [Saprospiraceae bacterium]